ncbi:hypothetical protein SSS_08971 [Sarcoptes scabiei]|uniref:Uncharacterized protein n=1 Tax=Sarcoptes scabiei TaxID=52283 RepID=A0A834VDD8_SARSC|nr:hypothetical protein SSS_08971 [Sarcoptes scabiei]
MLVDKSGQFCLTTLEYAFQSGCSFSTQCPSCGLRLVIRSDNLVNRFTSIGLLIGVSALIGYHFGANPRWIRFLSKKLFSIFHPTVDDSNVDDDYCDNDDYGDGDHRESSISHRRFENSIQNHLNKCRKYRLSRQFSLDQSDLATVNDSAVDFDFSESEDFEDQLDELTAYNQYYDDYYSINRKNPHSATIDKIDQVLHQIDDIKKSIVEIDDDLYHVTGSNYAKLNPDFFVITGYDEFDDQTMNKKSDRNGPNRKRSETNRQSSIRRRQWNHRAPNESNDDRRKSARLSVTSIDNLQLEWDESEYSFILASNARGNETKISNSDEIIDPTADASSSSSSSSSSNEDHLELHPTPIAEMSEEQKYQNMRELLEEAKHLGLLNNLIDAFLNHPTNSQSRNEENDDEEIG